MSTHSGVIEGTIKQIQAALAAMPEDEVVRLVVGRPSLSVIAKKLQDKASELGMNAATHDLLMASLKTDR